MLDWVSRQIQGVALPVGDEGVIAVVGEQGQLGAANWELGVGFTLRTMSRTGAASGALPNGVYSVSAKSAAPSIQ